MWTPLAAQARKPRDVESNLKANYDERQPSGIASMICKALMDSLCLRHIWSSLVNCGSHGMRLERTIA